MSSTQQPLDDLESVSGRGGYDSTSEPLLTDETVEAKKVLLTNATKVTEAATEQKTITMVDQNSTNFESRSMNDLRYKCMLKTKPLLSLSLARIILFQSNGAHQLKNFMAYYSRVLPMDSIVIIDHQSTDDGTSSLLKKYAGLGAHVWRCEGKFDYKDQMWSGVINRYAKQSEFVFPLDIDEYIAVLKPGPDPERDRGEQVLHWNHGDFSNALHELEDSGKPFKMEKGNAYPVDCNNRDREWLGALAEEAEDKRLSTSLQYEVGPMQMISFVGRRSSKRVECTDKVFMRGKDFHSTDTGNHYGQTHTRSMGKARHQCLHTNATTYAPDADQMSDLFMIHMQFTNFEEWLIHAFRGAADRGFNRFSGLKSCRKGMRSRGYCQGWEELMTTKFDPREMRKLYRKKACSTFELEHYLPYSIKNVLYGEST